VIIQLTAIGLESGTVVDCGSTGSKFPSRNGEATLFPASAGSCYLRRHVTEDVS